MSLASRVLAGDQGHFDVRRAAFRVIFAGFSDLKAGMQGMKLCWVTRSPWRQVFGVFEETEQWAEDMVR